MPLLRSQKSFGNSKSLSLGKDEGTALIAQTLYEAIDDCEIQAKKHQKYL